MFAAMAMASVGGVREYAIGALPSAAGNQGAVIPVSGIGGGRRRWLESDGTYWTPVNGVLVLAKETALSLFTPADTNDNQIKAITLPGNLCVPGSTVQVITTWTKTGTAGSGTYRPKLGGSSGTSMGTVTHTSTNTSAQYLTRFQVGATLSAQAGYGGGSSPFGGTTTAVPAGTKDLSVDQVLSLCMQLANAADSMILTSYEVMLFTP